MTKRVRLWNEVGPYYSDRGDKAAESRGTEAILNALILADHDARCERLSDDTLTAFNNMWALQKTTGDQAGAWPWLQFGLSPWEGNDASIMEPRFARTLSEHGSRGPPFTTPPSRTTLTSCASIWIASTRKQPLSNRVVLWASTRWRSCSKERARIPLNEILANNSRTEAESVFPQRIVVRHLTTARAGMVVDPERSVARGGAQ